MPFIHRQIFDVCGIVPQYCVYRFLLSGNGFFYCVTVIGTLVDLTYEFVIDSQLLLFHSVDHNWIVYFYLLYQ